MTEAEWLACTDLMRLRAYILGKINERKLRLFACACCRRVWSVTSESGRRAVEIAEGYADGEETKRALRSAWGAARWDQEGWEINSPEHLAALAARSASDPRDGPGEFSVDELAFNAAYHSRMAERRILAVSCRLLMRRISECEGADWQCEALRDIAGNPFRVSEDREQIPLGVGGVLVRIAYSIYNAGHFDELPILADALEDAGCTDAGVLSHLRSSGPHVRGCWALDLVLGKQ